MKYLADLVVFIRQYFRFASCAHCECVCVCVIDDVLSRDAGECVICLEELQQGDTIARLPCLCIYHKRWDGQQQYIFLRSPIAGHHQHQCWEIACVNDKPPCVQPCVILTGNVTAFSRSNEPRSQLSNCLRIYILLWAWNTNLVISYI